MLYILFHDVQDQAATRAVERDLQHQPDAWTPAVPTSAWHPGEEEEGCGQPALHWDQVLGGQREEALGEGAQQQDPWWVSHQTLHSSAEPGADQAL